MPTPRLDHRTCLLIALLGLPSCGQTPESRALSYLAHEVPRWPRENGCMSCHNNGDGSRVLFAAMDRGHAIPPESLAATLQWLARPGDWEKNQGEPRFNDRRLRTIQFAAALAAAVRSGASKAAAALRRAAEGVAGLQDDGGSWRAGAQTTIGGPTDYGPRLATYQALRVLQQADSSRFQKAIGAAAAFLLQAPLRNNFEAAVLLLAINEIEPADAEENTATGEKRRLALTLLREGQSSTGGWGPYRGSSPEVFDTALVLLGLAATPTYGDHRLDDLIAAARRFLLEAQFDNGGWEETTRPAGAQSYAQHISTTAWATAALLETR